MVLHTGSIQSFLYFQRPGKLDATFKPPETLTSNRKKSSKNALYLKVYLMLKGFTVKTLILLSCESIYDSCIKALNLFLKWSQRAESLDWIRSILLVGDNLMGGRKKNVNSLLCVLRR